MLKIFGSRIVQLCTWRVCRVVAVGLTLGLQIGSMLWLQHQLTLRFDGSAQGRKHIYTLLSSDEVKPLLLGYHHLAADLLWLQILQVLGQRDVPSSDYEWAYHALEVLTTLDPHYVYAYDMGGIVLSEMAHQVEWSNRLLKKGLAANPNAWRLAFQLGFNHFFHLQDYRAAADYLALAANLPGRPPYVPELSARLYAEAKEPQIALQFLASVRQSTHDPYLIAALDRRRDEVLIERDLMSIEQAVARYWDLHGAYPATLISLVDERLLDQLPIEPFAGMYQFDRETGQVRSSTHSRRLRIFQQQEILQFTSVSVNF